MRRPIHVALALLSFCPSLAAAANHWSVKPAGILQYDYAGYAGDRARGEADGARRTRAGLRAKHSSGLMLRFEWDFAAGTITDVYAEWPSINASHLRVGQFKQPFSLEQQGSSRDTALQERSMVHDAFNIGRRVGLMWTQPLAALTVQTSVFGGAAEVPSAARGIALRGFAAPIEGEQFHLGVALAHERRDDTRLRLRARAESRLLPFTPLDSGWQNGVDASWRGGLESAWLSGSLSLQAEWIALYSDGGEALDGAGGYIQASWLNGGAQRVLSDGKVRKPALNADTRLWEFSARLSQVELERDEAPLGRQQQLTFGVTALIGRHWQWALEHGRWETRRARAGHAPDLEQGRLTSARLQFSF
ncbi:OprO/OprP family phosphate-selective porin [Aquimonas sp.]|jgi:phosphate-selective porin OprO/OprP|uniref:OprO/OprP family phosphate-selective porin n=1 Tax=Aquimonas sp. TaxID=1872588 RepID=UPI0037C08A5C